MSTSIRATGLKLEIASLTRKLAAIPTSNKTVEQKVIAGGKLRRQIAKLEKELKAL